MTSVPDITLNDDAQIPQLGFGAHQIDHETTKAATLTALEGGHRQIDTAEMCGNEKEVGQSVRESGLARRDISSPTSATTAFTPPPGHVHRCFELPGPTPAAALRRDRDRARGEPDRGPPSSHVGEPVRVQQRARHRHRGLVPDRAG